MTSSQSGQSVWGPTRLHLCDSLSLVLFYSFRFRVFLSWRRMLPSCSGSHCCAALLDSDESGATPRTRTNPNRWLLACVIWTWTYIHTHHPVIQLVAWPRGDFRDTPAAGGKASEKAARMQPHMTIRLLGLPYWIANGVTGLECVLKDWTSPGLAICISAGDVQ